MKTFSIILTAAITAILFAAGCVNEEPAYKNEPGTTPAPEDGTGYLSMAGMTMRVIYDDQTDTQPDDTSSETVKPQTRAEEAQPDVDEFIVEIFDAEGTTVYKDTYANLRTKTADTDGKMELPTGSYKLEVRSEEPSSKLADWDHPVYFRGTRFCDRKKRGHRPRRDRLHAEQHQGDAHVLERPRGPVHRRNDLHDLAGRNADGLCQG